MKSSKAMFAYFFCALFLLFSCKKTEIIPDPDGNNGPITGTNALYSGSVIQSTIGGQVVDESGNPLANASVTIGNKSTSTNVEGNFLIQNANVDSERAYVKVSKSGYFLGSRAVNPSSSASSYVKIKLLSRTIIGSLNASNGGTINVSGGASIIFQEGDISLENGSPYNGNVHVYAKYIDPTRPDLGEVMPGNLAAINENGDAVMLQTFGMLAVELEGSNGEALNVTPGRTAQLKMPIATAQNSNAPSNIPLWYFNEVSGNWQEEGSALREGNYYIGNVSHFTIWNCDYPYSMKTVKMRIESGGQPIVNTQVQVTDQGNTFTHGYTFTDSNGEIEELVPGDLAVKFIVRDECGNEAYSQNVNPGLTDVDFGTIQISPPGTTHFSATVQNCSGAVVPHAIIAVDLGQNTVYLTANNNGVVNSVFLTCNVTNVEITAYDPVSAIQSTPTNYSVAPNMQVGTLLLCSQADEYFTFTANGLTYSIIETGNEEIYFYTYIIDSLTMQYGMDISANDVIGNGLYFQLTNPIIGNNTATTCSMWGQVSPGVWWSAYANQAPNIHITNGNINGPYIEGTIDGIIYDDGTNAPVPVTGNFRAKHY